MIIYTYVETYGISFFQHSIQCGRLYKVGWTHCASGRTAAKKLQNGALGEANYGETCGLW